LVASPAEPPEREPGRGLSSGAGECSSCVTHSPESPPSGRRTGFGGPTPPEHSPAPDATRPDCTCGIREQSSAYPSRARRLDPSRLALRVFVNSPR